jgi:hypothetical protein
VNTGRQREDTAPSSEFRLVQSSRGAGYVWAGYAGDVWRAWLWWGESAVSSWDRGGPCTVAYRARKPLLTDLSATPWTLALANILTAFLAHPAIAGAVALTSPGRTESPTH